jgi:osmoprotectant transport system permease protein
MSVATLLAAEPTNLWQWLGDSTQRTVSGSIPSQLWATLWHSVVAFTLAAAIAIPLAAWLAHRRQAELLAGWIVNIGRVIPTITLLGVFVLVSLRNGYGFEPWPIVGALTLLALPPLFANTYTAVREASPDAVSAARAVGLTERQVLTGVELPLAAPLIVAAARVTLTQVVATEALGALFGGSGLGIYVRYGFAGDDLYQIQAGALLVAGTAMAVDAALWAGSRLLLPRWGPTPPGTGSRRRPLELTTIQPQGGTP